MGWRQHDVPVGQRGVRQVGSVCELRGAQHKGSKHKCSSRRGDGCTHGHRRAHTRHSSTPSLNPPALLCRPQENIYRNFGMPQPNGYRKALRFMRHADKFG